MKSIHLLLSFLLLPWLAHGQADSLSLQECYALARQHYPLSRQKALIEQSRNYSVENAAKGYLPQVNIMGQATYQSEVTRVPIELPNMPIVSPAKDQYKVAGEISQNLFEGGVIRQQQRLIEANAAVQEQQVAVELYKLKERINQLYFGILLIEAQLKQSELLKNNIRLGLGKVNAAIANGAALKSSAQVLQADLLQANQKTIGLQVTRKAYLDMLGQFINIPLDENAALARPHHMALSASINRPELQLYAYQKNIADVQNELISAKNLPKAGLFLQGGYGRPGLNMLSNAFDFYYIGGVRLNWSLSGLYTTKNERELLDVNRSLLDVQQEVFLFNTNQLLRQQLADINKLRQFIGTDEEIIALRTAIMNTAKVQLENGAITARDYLREVNAEDQARQSLLLHQMQLLMAEHNYNTISGINEL
ncbi:TolC family protein [Pontibacter sp. 172403-2]|uniref:TolC family protein n=1 Tax=Pontibacter rufus TaxID=2791028 RepID=UPI0018B01182|nr:TolC family protein [Pontibacter sp. 172403-2]MBF9254057.1 TolC family protein [Pontibacter sp. 172403-2]